MLMLIVLILIKLKSIKNLLLNIVAILGRKDVM